MTCKISTYLQAAAFHIRGKCPICIINHSERKQWNEEKQYVNEIQNKYYLWRIYQTFGVVIRPFRCLSKMESMCIFKCIHASGINVKMFCVTQKKSDMILLIFECDILMIFDFIFIQRTWYALMVAEKKKWFFLSGFSNVWNSMNKQELLFFYFCCCLC